MGKKYMLPICVGWVWKYILLNSDFHFLYLRNLCWFGNIIKGILAGIPENNKKWKSECQSCSPFRRSFHFSRFWGFLPVLTFLSIFSIFGENQ